MASILAETFDILEPHLSSALFAPPMIPHLRELARSMVPLPALRLGFECRLAADAPRVDLQQGIVYEDGEPAVLRRFVDRLIRTTSPRAADVWRRLGALCLAWEDASSPIHSGLGQIWLEFDVTGAAPHDLVPSIFIGLRDEVSRPRDRWAVIASAFRTLIADGMAAQIQQAVWRCCNACPAGAGPTHMGFMLSRSADLVRLNLDGLSSEQAPSYLERVGWPGPVAEASALIDWLARLTVRVRLSLDVGAEVQPTLGLECLFGGQLDVGPRWASALDGLVSRGLCAPDKRDALLAWPGAITPRSSRAPWPGGLIGESLLRGEHDFTMLERQWSHLKITYSPHAPVPAAVEAKAYVGIVHTWLESEGEPSFERGQDRGRIQDTIDRAVGYLLAAQLPHGEFATYRFNDPACATRGRFDSSPFVTCFVLDALGLLQERKAVPAVASAIGKGVAFLLEEREEPGIWRFWTSRNGDRIDPDLDDTCCVSVTIRPFAGESWIVGNTAMILANRTPDGLFKTWFRAPEAPNVIDLAVNANVILYLGERDETMAALQTLNRVVSEDREAQRHWYYVDPLALYYMMSRAYRHGARGLTSSREAVIGKTRARQKANGSCGDELSTGLALCTLLNYGVRDEAVERAVGYLMHSQRRSGAWHTRPFMRGPEPPGPHSIWWGGQALTTAVCLEGLAKSLSDFGQ